MSSLTRSFRRSSRTRLGAGLLLAWIGLAAAGVEQVSSGHWHLAAEHAEHHSHLYLGAHEHSEPRHHDDPSDHDRSPDHDHEAPGQPDDAPRHTATVSAAVVLSQPVTVSALAAPPAPSALLEPAPAAPSAARPLVRSIPPRAPPVAVAVLAR